MYVLLTGMPGAGKEEFLTVAMEKDMDIVRMGDVVRETAVEEERFPSGDIGSFAHEERERHHYGIWADRTVSRMSDETSIIDGVRSAEEVEVFRNQLGDELGVVAIHASPKTRYERLKERNREDAPENWDEFKARDERELDWGLGKVIARADHIIINEGSLSDFRKKAEELLDSI